MIDRPDNTVTLDLTHEDVHLLRLALGFPAQDQFDSPNQARHASQLSRRLERAAALAKRRRGAPREAVTRRRAQQHPTCPLCACN
jgi:hypothetical protein